MNSKIVMAENDRGSFVERMSAGTLALLLLGAGLLLAQPCRGASIGFERTGSMGTARSSFTATTLPNGKVLVAGGYLASAGLASAELYDPANGTWEVTGSLATPRGGHTATLLSNGKVLVVGGTRHTVISSDIGSAELYDPASGTWTTAGDWHPGVGHAAVLLPNGQVLVEGGFTRSILGGGSTHGGAALFDPASGTWISTGSLATGRSSHTATLLPNGKVLVAGGTNSVSGFPSLGTLASAELYDPASGTWIPTGNLAGARTGHQATLLPGGKVLVAGGFYNPPQAVGVALATAELYDPVSETWLATGSLGAARSGHTMTLLPSGQVLVAGGSGGGSARASAELYHPSNGTWVATGSLTTARAGGQVAALLPTDEVLVAGGSNGSTTYASAEVYGKPIPTLLNISTRVRVQTGDNAMIGGFIITGTEPKTVIVRGIGPSLPVAGVLADPVIEVHGPSGQLLGTNDNWRDAATQQQINDSGLAPSSDLESALWGVINPGAYTVILTGRNGGAGVGLVEVYDLDRTVDTNLGNISTRGFVDTGDNVMIGGFIVGGGTPTGTAQVVVRAVGPSLTASGIAGALADPSLELYDGSGTIIASNDNWKTRPDGTSQQAEIEATTLAPTNDSESALVRTLAPGNYTVIVRGNNGTTGVGLFEAYHLP
jgi:Kelch motif protein/galactose oxidase-like protein